MKLFQLSWFLGMLSYVILGVFRRSELLPGNPRLAACILLILMAGIGIVLGGLSWKRREVNTWWTVGAMILNTVVLVGSLLYLAG